MKAINPVNDEVFEEFKDLIPEQTKERVERSAETFESWRRSSMASRSQLMQEAAKALRTEVLTHATLITKEMGKPIAQARAEVEKCAWACEYYAENAEEFLARQEVETDGQKSYVSFRPLGPVLAVMPWNFPFWQVFRFAAPALMAGNTALLKHASNVPCCAVAIEDLFRRVGFPEHAFQTLLVPAAQVPSVIEHPSVAAVTLTGSAEAGRAVALSAAGQLKKSVLELGGSDPYVVLADADLERTVAACVSSRLQNSGQSCIAAKRFIVVDSVYDQFLERMVEEMKNKKFGEPCDESMDLGPLARRDLRDDLHDQVMKSVAAGAKLALGGEVPDGPGAFYPPTVLSEAAPGQPAFDEETFGPVAAVARAKDEIDALRLANASPYGLGAAIFSRDEARAERLAAEELTAGLCFVNDYVRSDPRLPFGGVKRSGYGRELSVFGIREFVNVKTVYVA